MFDKADDLLSPRPRVLDDDIVAVLHQELDHRHEARPLIALLERMRLDDAHHHPDSENNEVRLAIAECILWTCERTFQQSHIAQEVVFASDRHRLSIYLNDRLDRQPPRLIRQGLSRCSETGR